MINAEVSTKVKVEIESTIDWIFGSTGADAFSAAASLELNLTIIDGAVLNTPETFAEDATRREDLETVLNAYMLIGQVGWCYLLRLLQEPQSH